MTWSYFQWNGITVQQSSQRLQYGEAKLTGLSKTEPVNLASPYCTSLITVGDLKINIYPPSIPLPGYCMKWLDFYYSSQKVYNTIHKLFNEINEVSVLEIKGHIFCYIRLPIYFIQSIGPWDYLRKTLMNILLTKDNKMHKMLSIWSDRDDRVLGCRDREQPCEARSLRAKSNINYLPDGPRKYAHF